MKKHKNEINISNKFAPLFELLKGKHPEVDTVIMTGGRYSLKSYTVSIFANTALAWFDWNILYTRYTNSTIIDSIKPEVSDKIEMLGLTGVLTDTKTHIEYKGNRIAFKGIKPGAKAQTANLKSLSGFNCFICDEAEELDSFKNFKKIFYSMRDTERRNLSILILNPTSKDHWIYKEFYDKKGLKGGENCIIDNVMYIHTSYLDATLSKMPKNIVADYERMKAENPKEYENIVLGGWTEITEGRIFNDWEQIDNFPELDGFWYGLDFGFSNDPTAIVKTIRHRNRLYFDEILYQTGLTNPEIARYIKSLGYNYEPVICDSAEPKSIQELQNYGINAMSADKIPGSINAGIDFLKRNKILVTKRSKNLIKENQKYEWMQDKEGNFINKPKDIFNHGIDSMRYSWSLRDFRDYNETKVDYSDL